MNTINIRRSVRKYKDQKVEADKLQAVLKAGMQAPSAGNQQPWEFVVVTDPDKKLTLSTMSPYAGAAKDAPHVIVVLANADKLRFPENMQQDLGACTQNILLEAVEQGLGTVWMSVFPQEERINCAKETLHLPEGITPYCLILIGYPKNEAANHFVDRYDATRIHYDVY